MSPPGGDDGAPGRLPQLDPDAAAASARAAAGRETGPAAGAEPLRTAAGGPERPAAFDPRRYRWTIGIIGLAIVVAVSVYGFVTHGPDGGPGVTPGHRLRWFAAPLASSDLQGDPNLDPPCTAAEHDPRALNLCLDAHRAPVVVSFFVTGSSACVRQVDALQTLSRRYPRVDFAAVAIGASQATTARLVATHHWTIPVAYDRDASVGGLYGIAVCPMAELASRGGIVRSRLIGDRWQTAAALAPRVAALTSRVTAQESASP